MAKKKKRSQSDSGFQTITSSVPGDWVARIQKVGGPTKAVCEALAAHFGWTYDKPGRGKPVADDYKVTISANCTKKAATEVVQTLYPTATLVKFQRDKSLVKPSVSVTVNGLTKTNASGQGQSKAAMAARAISKGL